MVLERLKRLRPMLEVAVEGRRWEMSSPCYITVILHS